MAVFFVVSDQSIGNRGKPLSKHAETEYQSNPEECKFLKLEAESLKEAQQAIGHYFANQIKQVPVVVTEAEWNETETGGGVENYFVVFGQAALPDDKFAYEKKWEKVTMLGECFEANFIQIKANSVSEARIAILRHFPTDIQTIPIVVKESAWKTS